MAQLTDLEKVRSARLWRKRVRSLLLLALFAVVVFALSMLVYNKGDMDLKSAVGDIAAEISAGSGYPVVLPGGKLLDIQTADNALVILADSNLYTYNTTGRKLLDVQHGMINPTVTAAGGRILAYDRGANKIMLFSRSGQLNQITSDFPVYDGDIARNGNFALASSSDKSLSRVIVYNGEGKEFYRCSFSDRPVISVSLADSRDSMVVGLVNVSGGEYLSSISRFQFSTDRDEPSAQTELREELLLSLDYRDGANVRMLSDRRAALLSSDFKELATYSFEDNQVMRFQYGDDGRLLLYLQQASSKPRGIVVLLDNRLQPVCTISLDKELEDMKFDSSGIYLKRKGELVAYDFSGTETARLPISGMGLYQPMNDVLYYATSSELCAVATKDMASQYEIAEPGNSDSEEDTSAPSKDTSAPSKDGWVAVRDALLGVSESSSKGASSSADMSSEEEADGSSSSPSNSNEEASGDEGSNANSTSADALDNESVQNGINASSALVPGVSEGETVDAGNSESASQSVSTPSQSEEQGEASQGIGG